MYQPSFFQQYAAFLAMAAAAVVFGLVFLWRRRGVGIQDLAPAYERFLEQTGYRCAELLDAPLQDQAKHMSDAWADRIKGRNRRLELNLVRDYHGAPILWQQLWGQSADQSDLSTYFKSRWTLQTPQSPTLMWEIVDKSLVSPLKGVKEAFSNKTRLWEPTHPMEVRSGDPELDQRFAFYAQNEHTVSALLRAPGLKQMLLQCTEVDLWTDEEGVHFSDPFQKNVLAARGGVVGTLALGNSPEAMLDASVVVHDQVAQLLALSARASE